MNHIYKWFLRDKDPASGSVMIIRSTRSCARTSRSRGMTLLELTVVIVVLISIITILFLGARAWKRGSDRTMCIMNIITVQKAVRSYSNLYGFSAGDQVAGLRNKLIAPGSFMESAPQCPGEGGYTYGATLGSDTIPLEGELYLTCSFALSHEHTPSKTEDW